MLPGDPDPASTAAGLSRCSCDAAARKSGRADGAEWLGRALLYTRRTDASAMARRLMDRLLMLRRAVRHATCPARRVGHRGDRLWQRLPPANQPRSGIRHAATSSRRLGASTGGGSRYTLMVDAVGCACARSTPWAGGRVCSVPPVTVARYARNRGGVEWPRSGWRALRPPRPRLRCRARAHVSCVLVAGDGAGLQWAVGSILALVDQTGEWLKAHVTGWLRACA